MYNSKDYQKLFHIGLQYLISDIFAQYYKTLKCLLIAENGLWTSYLPKIVIEQTQIDGVKLFTDEKLFNDFENDFRNYIEYSKTESEKILRDDLTKESSERFLHLVAGFWNFYSKTEFFYTDGLVNMKEYDISTSNLKRFEVMKNSGRAVMNSMIFEPENTLDNFLSSVSNKFSVSTNDLKLYSITEILELFNGNKVANDKLVKRQEFYYMVGNGSEIEYGEGIENKERFTNFFAINFGELTGVAANKGVVKGRVKVFPPSYYSDFSVLPKLFSEMEKGDILVAETTSPELLPACAKAGAIITNQGGLLSHAAIVSRELGIPCIVGVENATQVLKDGDLVEVDADKGIVRILEKAQRG